jgi:hypothetical protein
MTTQVLVRLAVAAVLLSPVVACDNPAAPQSTVEIEVSQSAYEFAAPIRLVITNTSRTLIYLAGCGSVPFVYRETLVNGSWVSVTPEFDCETRNPIAVMPGVSVNAGLSRAPIGVHRARVVIWPHHVTQDTSPNFEVH